MNLLQNNVLGGNKLNYFKAMLVLVGPTHILIWARGGGGYEKAKSPIKGGPGALIPKGNLKF